MILRSFGMLAEIRLGAMIFHAGEMMTAFLVVSQFLVTGRQILPQLLYFD
jgi:hypothetical protein